jgi:hypothetical protein
MDIFVQLRDFFINSIYSLPVSITSVILRMGFLLALCTLFLLIVWLYLPWRTVFSQTCVAFVSIIIALYIPFEEFRDNGKEFLAFFIFLAFLCMIFLPNKIPFWLTPRLGAQVRLRMIIKCVVWGVLILQMIVGYKS